ncbi:DUF2637 domain-containing protein [Actinomadura nitritigenes]|uniref:DUF2637 domain-containing protein n=1 Tax=Actinomadura nitritigenes TaxID=134602 RepID=UPI003D9444EE
MHDLRTTAGGMSRPTFLAHRATIVLMAIGVLVATGDGFAQSYAGLYRWAIEHHLIEWKAESFPLLVDLFVAVGELGLFALALEGHRLRRSGLSWLDAALPFGIATAGWGVSLVFNVGAVGHDFADQATAAVPPVASMLGLLVLLRTLHRLVVRQPESALASTSVTATLDAASCNETAPVAPLPWWPLPEIGAAGQGPSGYDLWDEIEPAEEHARDRGGDEADDLLRGGGEKVDEQPIDPDLAPVVATARDRFAEVLAAGSLPSVRRIRKELRVGHPRAVAVREALQGEVAEVVPAMA